MDKKITILEKEFYYRVIGEYYSGPTYHTIFYNEFETNICRKYILFGKKIEYKYPKTIFTVDFNIEIPKLTKQYVRERLEEKVQLLVRQDKINRG